MGDLGGAAPQRNAVKGEEAIAQSNHPGPHGRFAAGLDRTYEIAFAEAAARRRELSGPRWWAYRLGRGLTGSDEAPGLLDALRAQRSRERRPWLRWLVAQLGRSAAARRRQPPTAELGRREADRPDGQRARTTPPVLVTGVVPAGASGMRDYGDLLARELTALGFDARSSWVESRGGPPRAALAEARQFLALARGVQPGVTVVWNYSPVPISVARIPGPGVLFGLILRRRRIRVVGVLHELAQPLARRGWASKLTAVLQQLALGPVVAGMPETVATTDNRARSLVPLARWLGARVHLVPVFSNFDPPRPLPSMPVNSGMVAVVLDYSADFGRPDVVVGAVAALVGQVDLRLVLLGAPGPESNAARQWRHLAAEAGVADRLVFTGVVSAEEFSAHLQRADVVILPNEQGPSSRKGTLAAALAHGTVVVSLDGLMRWEPLIEADAVVVVASDVTQLASALERLSSSTRLRAGYRERAARFYDENLSLAQVGSGMAGIIRPE